MRLQLPAEILSGPERIEVEGFTEVAFLHCLNGRIVEQTVLRRGSTLSSDPCIGDAAITLDRENHSRCSFSTAAACCQRIFRAQAVARWALDGALCLR
jgi:hypothetical protein